TRPTWRTGPARPAVRGGWRSHAGFPVSGRAIGRALHGRACLAGVHLSARPDQRMARRRAPDAGAAPQLELERPPVWRALGILELLVAIQMALHGADHGTPQDLRDARARLPRISGFRVRVLYPVRLRARADPARQRPHGRRHREGGPPDRAVTAPIRHALVLTAGLGTRLRPLTDVRA